MLRVLVSSVVVIGAGLAATLASAPAMAHGHHGGHAHHGHRGFGHRGVIIGAAPLFGPRPFYYHPYYPYYAPATVYVMPSPVYSAPWPGECRVFQGDAVVDGTGEPYEGTACWQPDGRWHIVG